ncbi:hypothetical protein KY289_013396 [Solanum tuberosum]|nr:hypothetical protein KY289_013396 [Solanum tuberosum]
MEPKTNKNGKEWYQGKGKPEQVWNRKLEGQARKEGVMTNQFAALAEHEEENIDESKGKALTDNSKNTLKRAVKMKTLTC